MNNFAVKRTPQFILNQNRGAGTASLTINKLTF